VSDPVEASPYPKAKPHLQIDPDAWEDSDWLCDLVAATASELPMPRPKRAKKAKARA